MDDCMALILAAGQGVRMRSAIPKVLHSLCGKPIISYIVSAVKDAGVEKCVVVTGPGGESIKDVLGDGLDYVYQAERLGTGHAVMMARHYLNGDRKYALVLPGDVPLIKNSTLRCLYDTAREGGYAAVVLTAVMDDPKGYGRIIRDSQGNVAAIVEDKDADESQKAIKEINSAIYCFDADVLNGALDMIDNNNAQHEYYLTDVLAAMAKQGLKVGAVTVEQPEEVIGINDRVQLARVERLLRSEIAVRWMTEGVTIIDPSSVYIDTDVRIGQDTIIYPGNVLEQGTIIGRQCILYPNSRLSNAIISDRVTIQSSVIIDSEVGDDTTVGPFAYLRPGTRIGRGTRIGDFVEIKNSTIGDGTKVPHLCYVGDADVGKKVNFGCGSVVVNYDGVRKYRTIVKDNAFIGCNANLVSPVEVEENAYIAAGSTITDKVPAGALAIARARQVVKEGWVAKKFKKGTEEE